MSTQADVKSLDALAFMKAALAAFVHETGQAVSEVELQGQRAVEWITVDRAAFWKAECRRATDAVTKAMQDLEHCRTFKKVGDHQPSCAEEKKALEKARKRRDFCERKAEAVRRWTPVVQQQYREACVRLVRFREVIDSDCPRAMARLEKMLKSLDAYTAVAGPRPSAGGDAAAAGPTMARTVDEAAAASAPAPPPSAPAPPEGR
jgi:hypothetical protein